MWVCDLAGLPERPWGPVGVPRGRVPVFPSVKRDPQEPTGHARAVRPQWCRSSRLPSPPVCGAVSPAPRGQCTALVPRKAAALPSHRVTRHQRLAQPEFQLHVHGKTSGPFRGGRGWPVHSTGPETRSCGVSPWLTRFRCCVAFLHPVCVSPHGSSPLSH